MAEIYKALEEFSDKNGKGGVYQDGELYPKKLSEIDAERVKVLLGDNKYKRPFIKRLTNNEVKQILDEKEIDYDAKANRDILISLLE